MFEHFPVVGGHKRSVNRYACAQHPCHWGWECHLVSKCHTTSLAFLRRVLAEKSNLERSVRDVFQQEINWSEVQAKAGASLQT